MPVCGVKRSRSSVDDDSDDDSVDLELQQRCLLDISVSKLQQEQTGQGSEPKLLKSVLISNAVRRLQLHLNAFTDIDIDILTTEDVGDRGSPANFFNNTFGPSGYFSVIPSPCPEVAKFPEDQGGEGTDKVEATSAHLTNFASALLDRLEGIMEVEVDSSSGSPPTGMDREAGLQVVEPPVSTDGACHSPAGVPMQHRSPSTPCTTTTAGTEEEEEEVQSMQDSREEGGCGVADTHSHSRHHHSCTEPASEDSGLGESMDVPLSLVVQDFHSVDLSLYDYDSQDPLHPSIGCLGDGRADSLLHAAGSTNAAEVSSETQGPLSSSVVSPPPSPVASTYCRYNPLRESPLATVCRRSDFNSSSANFLGFPAFSGLFVELSQF